MLQTCLSNSRRHVPNKLEFLHCLSYILKHIKFCAILMEYILCRNNWSRFNFSAQRDGAGRGWVGACRTRTAANAVVSMEISIHERQSGFLCLRNFNHRFNQAWNRCAMIFSPSTSHCWIKINFVSLILFSSPLNEKQKNFCGKRPSRKVGKGKQFGHYLLLINLLILFINYFFLGGLPFFQVNH